MKQIDQKLRETLITLNQKYIDTPYKNIDDDLKFIFYGIREEKFRRISNCDFWGNKPLYKTIQLEGDVFEREQMLENQIINIVDDCKREKDFFNNFTAKICKQFQGFNFKCGLKLNSKMDRKSMQRVK